MRRVEKPWGHEEIWAETEDYLGKLLFIRAGHRLSLQHHQVKDETIRVSEGCLEVLLEDDNGELVTWILEPGDSLRVRPQRKHRFKGITDCFVYEVSTAYPDDVVRHQDDYGRQGD